jgi:apolipoprotein N-acyltransferase
MLAAASGLVFAAATPPIDFQPGILLGLVGFAFALAQEAPATAQDDTPPSGARRAKRGAAIGFAFGVTANVLALRFVPEVMQRFTSLPAIAGWVALVLLSAAQALPWMLGGALARSLTPPRALTPRWLAFGTGVYFATFVPALFPWTPAGGLARWPILLQTAELVGERGTSLLVALACGLIADGVGRQSLRSLDRDGARSLATGGVVFAVLVAYGGLRTPAIEAARAGAEHARVALLQPDFDALFRWDEAYSATMIERLGLLTKRAEREGATLTVWPESAYPYTLAHGTKHEPRGARAVLQPGVHGPVLTGAYMSKGGGLGTNSAILVSRGGAIDASYDKRHLLWFGETVPLADTFPVLRQIFARGTGLEAGTTSVAFETGSITLAVLNCYEDTLPVAGREAMSVRPNLLVNVTNDAWFAGSAEGELHLRLAILRAIETGAISSAQ